MKLNFNFDGKTLLKDWWKIVRDNFTAIQTDHNELSDSVNTHKTAEVIDHPDKSVTSTKIADKAIRTAHIANYAITKDKVANGAVTTDKIAANSITVNELTLDIVANLGKANTFLYSDGEPIYLSECKDTGGIGYELPDDIPVNVFFKLENDTDSALTKFQSHDDYYTTLSCDIAPGEVRICVLIQEEVGGADPQNGYLFVLDDNSIRKLLNDKAPTNHASGATTYGVGDATNYGHLKLSDSTASVSSTGSGIAATPKAVKTISDTLSTEISDRQAADNELKAKIADINSELTTDNLFYDLSKYVNSDNKLVTDDSGVQYLSYSGTFDVVYLYHNFVVDNFRRKPKTKTTLELTFNVASRHIAGGGCDIGGLNIGETDVLITYTDTTTERFGQSYYTATDTGDKTITINGTSETYKTTKFKIEIPVKKEIKSISFRIVSDNYYTNGDPTGNVCEQETLIQSAVCYDDECVVARKELDDFVQVIETALDGKAPTNHASNGTGFGKGTRTAFGHVKLSEVINSSTGADAGIAVAPKAVKTAYDKAVSAYELADGKLDANFVSNGYAGIDEVTTTLSDMWRDRVAPPTTITVACSTSKHNITADYHCNGTNDQTVIQQAIDALPSTGGKIVLLEGTYNISGQITVNQPNVTICGMGNNTILKAAKSSSTLTMLRCSNHSGFKISNLVMDFENNSSAQCIGIQLYVSGHSTIENISILNNKGNGIEWYKCDYTRFNGVSFVNVRQCIWDRGYNHSSIFSGVIIDTATNGIVLETNSELNQIDGCIVRYATGKGISSDSAYTMINDNIVYGCGVGITANGNCSTVSGNNACDNDTGISINGKMINVSGNTAVRTDGSGNVSSYSSSQYTILLGSSSKNCFVTCNLITGKNYTNNGNSTHTITNNKY